MLNIDDSLLLVIDVQEKLVKAAKNGDIVASNTSKLVKASEILNIPTVITEQYPKGLGSTVDGIEIFANTKVFEKSAFSALLHEEISSHIDNAKRKQILLCGIEAHICVLQTAEDLKNKGYEVYIVKDACASRSDLNYNTALEYANQIGIKTITTEIALFSWLKTSKHPNFKEVQALIK